MVFPFFLGGLNPIKAPVLWLLIQLSPSLFIAFKQTLKLWFRSKQALNPHGNLTVVRLNTSWFFCPRDIWLDELMWPCGSWRDQIIGYFYHVSSLGHMPCRHKRRTSIGCNRFKFLLGLRAHLNVMKGERLSWINSHNTGAFLGFMPIFFLRHRSALIISSSKTGTE